MGTTVVLLATGLLFAGGMGQDTTVIVQGQVLDYVTGDPLRSVEVRADEAGVGTLTDEHGRFRLAVPWPETLGLTLSQLGYQPTFFPLADVDRLTGLEILLPPNPILLEGLEAVVDRFEVRRRREQRKVYVWDPEKIMVSGGGNLWELIRREVPFSRPCRLNRDFLCRYGRTSTFAGRFDFNRTLGSATSSLGSLSGESPVGICVNGRPSFGGAAELRGYPLSEVYRIEFVGLIPSTVRIWTRDYMQLMVAGEVFLPRMDPRTGC